MSTAKALATTLFLAVAAVFAIFAIGVMTIDTTPTPAPTVQPAADTVPQRSEDQARQERQRILDAAQAEVQADLRQLEAEKVEACRTGDFATYPAYKCTAEGLPTP